MATPSSTSLFWLGFLWLWPRAAGPGEQKHVCVSARLLFTRRNLGSKGLGNCVLVLFVFFLKQEAQSIFYACVSTAHAFFVSGLFSLFISVSIVHFFTLFWLLFYFLFALCSGGFARIIFAVRTGTHSTRARVFVLRFC
jgi:hypothetical protein